MGAYIVVFDLETTGFGYDADIVQISAEHGGRQFNKYILPKNQISIAASKVTKIEKHGKNLYYDGQVVEADNLEHAMSEFLNWLPDKSLLFAHNGKNFDSKILIQTLNSLTLSKEKSVGFVDTLLYFTSDKNIPNFTITIKIICPGHF